MANVSSSNGLEKRPKLRFSEFNSNWTSIKLGLAGEFYGGLSGKSKEDFGHGDGKFITYRNVFSNTFASDKLLESVDIHQNERQNRVQRGDVLFTQSSETFEEVGMSSVWLHSAEPFLNSFCMGWRPSSSDLNPVFLGYLLRTPTIRKQIICQGQGISRINLAASRIGHIDLYHPSLDEQLKIANILSLLDQRIEAVCKIIEYLKKYKRGFLRESFSKQNDWDVLPISSIGKVVTGSTPPTDNPENYGGNKLFCAPSDVGTEKYISSTIKRVSEKGFYTGRIIPKGTILVTCIGLIGKLGIAMQDMITNQQINSLIVAPFFDNEFVYYALEYALPRYAAQASMQTMPILSKSEFEKITLQLPDIKKQKEISQPLALLDRKIATLTLVLENLIALKNGLLEKLFI